MSTTRLLLTWLVLALLMPLNGILREFGLRRLMPDMAAEWLSAATGIAIILGITRWLFRIPAETANVRLLAQSGMLVALTIGYEFAIGFASGRDARAMASSYALWDGRPWPLVLLALAASPWLWRGE